MILKSIKLIKNTMILSLLTGTVLANEDLSYLDAWDKIADEHEYNIIRADKNPGAEAIFNAEENAVNAHQALSTIERYVDTTDKVFRDYLNSVKPSFMNEAKEQVAREAMQTEQVQQIQAYLAEQVGVHKQNIQNNIEAIKLEHQRLISEKRTEFKVDLENSENFRRDNTVKGKPVMMSLGLVIGSTKQSARELATQANDNVNAGSALFMSTTSAR